MTDRPNPRAPRNADIQIGNKIRLQRVVLGMSQERLAKEIGVTFQQVQKYEKGINRVSPARLQDIARALNMPVAHFFDDETAGKSRSESREITGFIATTEGIALNRAFARVRDKSLRASIVSLTEALAGTAPNAKVVS